VKARSKGRGHSNFFVKARRPGADQQTRPHRGRGAVLDLALHFAGLAADAAALVEFDQIFAHDNSRKDLEAVTAQVVRLKAEGLKIKYKARLPPFKAYPVSIALTLSTPSCSDRPAFSRPLS
jgi:hypothetical protein